MVWRPMVELMKEENEYAARVLLPGVHAGDIEVLLAPDVLPIKREMHNSPAIRSYCARSSFRVRLIPIRSRGNERWDALDPSKDRWDVERIRKSPNTRTPGIPMTHRVLSAPFGENSHLRFKMGVPEFSTLQSERRRRVSGQRTTEAAEYAAIEFLHRTTL
jgi:hypothetical protein